MDTHAAVHNLMQAQLGQAASMINLGTVVDRTGEPSPGTSTAEPDAKTPTSSPTAPTFPTKTLTANTAALVTSTCATLQQQVAAAQAKVNAALNLVQHALALPGFNPSSTMFATLLTASRALGDLEGQYVACASATPLTPAQLQERVNGLTKNLMLSEAGINQNWLERDYAQWLRARTSIQTHHKEIAAARSWSRQAAIMQQAAATDAAAKEQAAAAAAQAEADAAAKAAAAAQAATAQLPTTTAAAPPALVATPESVAAYERRKRIKLGVGIGVVALGIAGIVIWRRSVG